MGHWKASDARLHMPQIIDAAVEGDPQFVRRRDGKEVVIVSRAYFDSTRPNLKSVLLNDGYTGDGEDALDHILRDIRVDGPGFVLRQVPEAEG